MTPPPAPASVVVRNETVTEPSPRAREQTVRSAGSPIVRRVSQQRRTLDRLCDHARWRTSTAVDEDARYRVSRQREPADAVTTVSAVATPTARPSRQQPRANVAAITHDGARRRLQTRTRAAASANNGAPPPLLAVFANVDLTGSRPTLRTYVACTPRSQTSGSPTTALAMESRVPSRARAWTRRQRDRRAVAHVGSPQ